jgi:hypothetical protein
VTIEPDDVSNNHDTNEFSQYKENLSNESPFGVETKNLKELLQREDPQPLQMNRYSSA